MKPIRILPHHAIHFFEVFYLDWTIENALSWYNDEKMKENGIRAIRMVVQNQETLVQIVDSYDETCRMCPKNKHGDNYYQNKDDTCTNYDDGVSDKNFATILGLEGVLDREPISAKQFFELMKPTYAKLISEPEEDYRSKNHSLQFIFRRCRDRILQLKLQKQFPQLITPQNGFFKNVLPQFFS